MFTKILYPTDFSDVSEKALAYIKGLKDSGAREVIVLHVIDERGLATVLRLLGEEKYEKLIKSKKEETQAHLQAVAKELTEAGLKVTVRAVTGIPVREILRAEAQEEVSAIIIGSHGVSNLEEMFLGSVSEKVIRRCQKPVFVIKR